MKKIFLIALTLCSFSAFSQRNVIAADTIEMKSYGANGATLIIRSNTKDSAGFLYNIGNGVTKFKKALVRIDSFTYLIGEDTLHVYKNVTSEGGGTVLSVTGNPTGLVDNTDPANPVVQQDVLKLNVSDTANKWLSDVDSVAPNTIRFYKGTGYKDFVFTGVDTSHLSDRINQKFNTTDTTGKWLADGVISVTTLPDSSGFVFSYKNGLSDTIKLSGVAGISFYGKNATKDSTILLLTDGTRFAAKDSIGAGGGSVAGSNNQIQRNISGSLGASADFSYNSAGFLSGTKNYVGLFVNPVVTPTANTDTTSVAEFRKSFSNGALTGIINQTFKFSNQSGNGLSSYLNIDSLFNFTWGLGNAALPSGGNTISLGKFAGQGGTGADNSVNIGYSAGYNSTNQSNSVNIGNSAGYNAPSANTSINIGLNAGKNATSANTSINIGQNSASGATSANESINIGNSAGSGATGATRSINIGSSTGLNATGASNSVFSGFGAGSNATNATKSNFLGYFTGSGATGASYSFFEGFQTGYNGTHAITGTNNILIGTNITTDTANASNMASIGNVLYLRNTYSTTSGNPSKVAQSNGQLGINVSRPDTSTVADFESPLQTKGILIPRLPSVQKRLINTGIKTGSISGGTSYTTGSYPGISLTGGTGKGAIATVNVSVGGSVTGVVINYPGYDYSVGDVLTGTGFGAGSGFTYTVTALKVAPKGLILADTTQGLLNIYNGRKFGAMSAVFSKFDSTAQTSAISSLTSLVSDSLATYTIGGYLNVTAVSTDIIQLQCTYTDENNNNQTVSFGNISTVGNSNYSPITIRVKAGSTITIKSNLSTGGGSVTYDAGGYIRKDY